MCVCGGVKTNPHCHHRGKGTTFRAEVPLGQAQPDLYNTDTHGLTPGPTGRYRYDDILLGQKLVPTQSGLFLSKEEPATQDRQVQHGGPQGKAGRP